MKTMSSGDDEFAESSSPLAAAVSWAALILACLCVMVVSWYVPWDRERYLSMFQDFDLELPRVTVFVISIPGLVFPVCAAGAVLTMAAVQYLSSSKSGAAVFHLLVIAMTCVALVAYREVMAMTMADLMEHLSG